MEHHSLFVITPNVPSTVVQVHTIHGGFGLGGTGGLFLSLCLAGRMDGDGEEVSVFFPRLTLLLQLRLLAVCTV